MTQYVDLHTHTDFSVLDGLGTVKQYVAEAERQKKNHLAITDHGTLSGSYEFYSACRDADINPILGMEAYFVPNAAKAKEDKISTRFHVVLLARNVQGYHLLCELSTASHQQYYYKPLIDRPLLESFGRKHMKNLVCLSGCAASILSKKVLEGNTRAVESELEWWREIFPNFFIELQNHETSFDKKLNTRLLQVAKKYNLPWLITNDSHFVHEEQKFEHDALLAIQTNAALDDPNRFSFEGSGYHLRTKQEMAKAFRSYGKEVFLPAMKQTERVAANCALDIPEWNSRSWHIPKFTAPEQKDSHTYLCELVKTGLKERGLTNPTYIARAKHELKIMKSVGMADFLLITRDIIQRAKAKGIPVGPGRGSVGASLVGMLIGISTVDPIRYSLLFERFLNPERPKMPDIDTDFSQARRDEVIQDIKDTYGAENVLPVAAFGTLQFKSVFQVLAKAHGIEFQERMKWSKLMEEDEEGGTILPKELSQAYPDLLDQMLKIVGTKRSIASHPSGVIIFDPKDSVRKLVPQIWLPKSGQRQGRFIAAFDLKSAEKMGLMKQDILGLRTLDTIAECVALLDRRHGDSKAQWCDPDAWVPDEESRDKDVYKMLASGDTAGVFQLEGAANSRGIVEMKPKEFNDIVHTTAMYRAGPIGAGAPARYLKNKKDKKVRVLHPSLEPILAETHGEMIYQESLMQIVNKVAGLSMTKVDEIKEIVRFKDATKMNAFLDEFISGCVETVGMDKETAEKLWLTIEAQSTYLYNKIHATSYSILTYQTARLKCLWPLEFYTALLRTVLGKNPEEKAKRVRYLTCCINLGFRILPPDINKSDALTNCFGKRSIRMGFQDVKGIGPAAATKLIEKRNEVSKFSSLEQVSKELGEGLYKKLAAVGALYSLGGPTAKPRVLEEMTGWCFNDEMALVREKFKKEVILPNNQDGQVHIIGEIISTERRKTKGGKPFMTWKLRWSPAEVFNITIWEDAEALWSIPLHSVVSVSGKYQKEFSNVACGSSHQVQTIRRASGS